MEATATMRAFFAAPLGEGTARALEAGARQAADSREWRLTPPERVHVTLKFLGDTPLHRLPDLRAALQEAAASVPPFRADLGDGLLLPDPGDPRVLAVALSDPAGSLPRLASLLEARAEALGFPREGRPFLGHVTVARRRRGRRGPAAVHPRASRRVEAVVLNRIVLMESRLGPDGPAYSVVEEAALGGGR